MLNKILYVYGFINQFCVCGSDYIKVSVAPLYLAFHNLYLLIRLAEMTLGWIHKHVPNTIAHYHVRGHKI